MKKQRQSSKHGPIQLSANKKSHSISLKNKQQPLFTPYKIQWKTPNDHLLFGNNQSLPLKQPFKNIQNNNINHFNVNSNSKAFYQNMKNELFNIKQDVQKLILKQKKVPNLLIFSNQQEKYLSDQSKYRTKPEVDIKLPSFDKFRKQLKQQNTRNEQDFANLQIKQDFVNIKNQQDFVNIKNEQQNPNDYKKIEEQKNMIIQKLQSELNDLQKELSLRDELMSRKQQTKFILTEQIQKLKRQMQKLRKQKEQQRQRHNQELKQREQIIRKCIESQNKCKQENKKYEQKSKLFQQQICKYQDQMKINNRQIEKYKQQISIYKQLTLNSGYYDKQYENKASFYQQQLQKAIYAIRQKEQQNFNLIQTINNQNININDQNIKINQLNQQINEPNKSQLNKVVNELNRAINQYKRTVNQQNKTIEQLSMTVQNLSNKVRQMKKDIEESKNIKQKMKMKDNQIYIYQEELKEAKLKIKSLKQKINDGLYERENNEEQQINKNEQNKDKTINKTSNSKSLSASQHQNIMQVDEKLKWELKQISRVNQTLKLQNQKLIKQLQSINSSSKQTQSQLSTQLKQNNQLKQKVLQLQRSKEKEINQIISNSQLGNIGNQISKKLSLMIDQNYTLKNKVNKFQSQLEEQSLKNKSLTEQLNIYKQKQEIYSKNNRCLKVQDWDLLSEQRDLLKREVQETRKKYEQIKEHYDVQIMKKQNMIWQLKERILEIEEERDEDGKQNDTLDNLRYDPKIKQVKHIKNISQLLSQFKSVIDTNIQLQQQLNKYKQCPINNSQNLSIL